MGFFSKLLQVAGLVLSFIPGLNLIGVGLMVGATILDYRAAKKEARRALQSAQGQTFMIRAPIVERRLVYGKTRLGGIMVHATTLQGNRWLMLVLALCDGPVEEIADIYFNDEKVELTYNAGNGLWNGAGKWLSKVTVGKMLGATNQAANDYYVTNVPEWTTDHRLLGVAYIVVGMEFDQTLFPNGMPNISADVKGLKVVDGRDDVSKYTNNRALCLANYITHPVYGPKMDFASELEHNAFDDAADACDDLIDITATGNFTVDTGTSTTDLICVDHGLEVGHIVTIAEGGTLPSGLSDGTDYHVVDTTKDTFKVSLTLDGDPVSCGNNGTPTNSFTAKERRYTFNGMISLEDSPEEIIRRFSIGMAGVSAYIGGKWSIFPGVWDDPTPFTIIEDMVIGDVTITPKRSKRDRVNTVKGFYLPHRNRYQPTAYPVQTNSAYVTADGGDELIMQADFQDIRTHTMAQRVAKILLEINRKEIVIELTTNLEGFKATAGRNLQLNLPRYGLNNEPFRVEALDFVATDGRPGFRMILTQTGSSIYGWTPGTDEQEAPEVEAPPLPDGTIQDVAALIPINPTGEPMKDEVRVDFTWTAPTQSEVINGGVILIEAKLSSDPDVEASWKPIAYHDANANKIEWNAALPSTQYDFRAKFQGFKGGQSANWLLVEDFTTTINSTENKRTFVYDQPVPATVHVIPHKFGRPASGIRVWRYSGGTPSIVVDMEQTIGAVGDDNGLYSTTLTFTVPVGIKAYLT